MQGVPSKWMLLVGGGGGGGGGTPCLTNQDLLPTPLLVCWLLE